MPAPVTRAGHRSGAGSGLLLEQLVADLMTIIYTGPVVDALVDALNCRR